MPLHPVVGVVILILGLLTFAAKYSSGEGDYTFSDATASMSIVIFMPLLGAWIASVLSSGSPRAVNITASVIVVLIWLGSFNADLTRQQAANEMQQEFRQLETPLRTDDRSGLGGQ
jgi:cation transport ATPase